MMVSRPSWVGSIQRIVHEAAADEGGATAVEYCMIAVMLSLVILAAMTVLFSHIGVTFNTISNALG